MNLSDLAADTLRLCRLHGARLVTVESCTGGLVAAALTDVPGSSDVFDRAYVTYSNTAKHQMVGVPKKLLDQHGAVSEAVARAMAEGGLAKAKVEVSVAITGVAVLLVARWKSPSVSSTSPAPRRTARRWHGGTSGTWPSRALTARASARYRPVRPWNWCGSLWIRNRRSVRRARPPSFQRLGRTC